AARGDQQRDAGDDEPPAVRGEKARQPRDGAEDRTPRPGAGGGSHFETSRIIGCLVSKRPTTLALERPAYTRRAFAFGPHELHCIDDRRLNKKRVVASSSYRHQERSLLLCDIGPMYIGAPEEDIVGCLARESRHRCGAPRARAICIEQMNV